MATLYVFNPEHDLALASNLRNFTSPLAGRKMRAEKGWLPAIWASDSDFILVEDATFAMDKWLNERERLGFGEASRQFVEKKVLSRLAIDKVDPWGWDLAIKYELIRHGVDERLFPSDEALEDIRQLSHRRTAVALLSRLEGQGLTGQSFELKPTHEAWNRCQKGCGPCVYKAPWSSSGRGVRFFEGEMSDADMKWVAHVIEQQGSVILEPYYNKVKDFGMEFYAHEDGSVEYLGLSVFETRNGTYLDNIVALEEEKTSLLTPYVLADLLQYVREEICRQMASIINRKYVGCFGVDMMIVKGDDRFLVHPCVEVNLRRTMGWIALIPRFRGGLLLGNS